MPTLNSSAQSVSLTSTIKTTYDADGNHQESKSSNTATDSRTFSVSIPSGAVVSACTFYFTQNSSSTYGGSAKVNSVERTSGSYSIALGAVTATTVSFSWKSRVTAIGSAPHVASYSQTISWSNCYIAVDYYYPYSACGAPTAVSTPSNVAPSTNYTLSWSGASSGTSNGISGYQVYRSTSPTTGYAVLGGKVVTTAANGSMTVTSHATSGSIYYYKVATYGSVAGYDSGLSSAYATLKTLVTAPSAPTSISTPTDVAPGSTQSLTWSGASNGTNNAISKYHIYRSTDGGANYTYLAEEDASPLTVTSSPDNGGTYYYKIYTIGARGNSAISSVFAGMRTTVGAPGVPTTVTVENGASVAPGKTRTLSWSGASAGTNNTIKGYHVYRSVNGEAYAYLVDVQTTSTGGSLVVDAASTAATYAYRVLVLGNTLSVNSEMSSVYGTLKTETVPSTGTLTAASVVATGSNKIGITIVPQPETSYTHQITWSIPDTSYTSGTLSLLANDLYDEFIVPQAWILATTKDTTSATAECRIETFLGTDIIGSHGYSFVVNVPPKSTIALSDGPVSANGTDKKTVTIAPTYAGYSHKVTWTTAGYTSGAIAVASGVMTSDFAVPLTWNNASPNDGSFLVTCTVESFKDTADGSRSLGNNLKTYTVDVPSTIVPIITFFTAAPVDAYWGLYVKTKSRCSLTPVLQAAYSSPIVSFQIVGATQNSGSIPYVTAAGWTTAQLQVHGDPITFTVSATDGRNRTASSTVDIAIADYASPSITGVTFGRAIADGTLHNQGTYINAKATFTYSAVGDNSITAKAYYRQLGSSNWIPTAGAGMISNTILTYGDGAIVPGYLYDVKITLSDYFTTVEHTAMVAKAVKVWDIREDRASFGAFATNPKELYVPADWKMKVGTETVLTDSRETLSIIGLRSDDHTNLITSRTMAESVGGTWDFIDVGDIPLPLENNTIYTLSVCGNIETMGVGTKFRVGVALNGTTKGYAEITSLTEQVVAIPFNSGADAASKQQSIYGQFIPYEDEGTVRIKWTKLEKGNAPTPWNPSVENTNANVFRLNGFTSYDFLKATTSLGGTNLLRNSHNIDLVPVFPGAGSASIVTVGEETYTRITHIDFSDIFMEAAPSIVWRKPLVQNLRYAISVDVRVEGDPTDIVFNDASGYVTATSDKWTRLKGSLIYGGYMFFGLLCPEPGRVIHVKDWKVEQGDIATDWSPAPDDMASEYLGLTAKAADSDKLDGKHASEIIAISQSYGENLLANSDWLRGVSTNWVPYYGTGGTASLSSDYPINGKQALKLSLGAGEFMVSTTQTVFLETPATEPTPYVASFYHYINAATIASLGAHTVIFGLKLYDGNNVKLSEESVSTNQITSAENWVRHIKTFTAPVGTSKFEVIFYLTCVSGAAAAFYFSSAKLERGGKVTDWRTLTEDIPLLAYPVGAVYKSRYSTSPAMLFGGTWSAIPAGTFLVAAGTGYAAGSTGGAATHTHTTPNHAHTTPSVGLTVAQLASHTHGSRVDNSWAGGLGSGNDCYPGFGGTGMATTSAGSGSAHGHGNTGNAAPTTNSASSLPPWTAYYMWERTA